MPQQTEPATEEGALDVWKGCGSPGIGLSKVRRPLLAPVAWSLASLLGARPLALDLWGLTEASARRTSWGRTANTTLESFVALLKPGLLDLVLLNKELSQLGCDLLCHPRWGILWQTQTNVPLGTYPLVKQNQPPVQACAVSKGYGHREGECVSVLTTYWVRLTESPGLMRLYGQQRAFMLQGKHGLFQVRACSGYPPHSGNSPSEALLLPGDSGDHANTLGLMTASLGPQEGRTPCKGETGLRTSLPCSTTTELHQCQQGHRSPFGRLQVSSSCTDTNPARCRGQGDGFWVQKMEFPLRWPWPSFAPMSSHSPP